MQIVIADTTEARNAANAMSARLNVCIQGALDAAEIFDYCGCTSCSAQWAAEAAAETWAENAWLRAAESSGEPCRGIFLPDGGCACC